MTRESPVARSAWRALPTLVAAGLVAVVLGLYGDLPRAVGLAIALGATAVAAPLELARDGRFAPFAPVPLLLGFLALVASLPSGPGTDLLAGLGGVTLLAWCAADPARPGGVARGLLGWGLPGLAVGLAWVSSFLLPPSSASVGVAGGLLAATLIALAALFRRPDLVETGAAPTI
jgi:hypothetical protein